MTRSKTPTEPSVEGTKRASEERDRIIAAIFDQEYDRLRRLAYVVLGDSLQAEEVVMDAFARAQSGRRVSSAVADPVPYLRRMVVNACRSKLRRFAIEQRMASILRRPGAPQEPEDGDARGDALTIWQAVNALPTAQRICVVLRDLEDMKESQIADLLDLPLGSVKSNLSRARARLSRSLGPSFEGDAT